MESAYRNLSWTRLVSMQHEHDPENQQWPIAPDLVENQEIIQAMEEQEHDDADVFLFDPSAFSRSHPAP